MKSLLASSPFGIAFLAVRLPRLPVGLVVFVLCNVLCGHAALAQLAPYESVLAPDSGKLPLTAGFNDVDGAGGAGLVPWALITATTDKILVSPWSNPASISAPTLYDLSVTGVRVIVATAAQAGKRMREQSGRRWRPAITSAPTH